MRREVSIHAPLRGATIIGSASESKIVQFQSTHPCGVRRGIRYSTCLLKGFNPRTPAGCDYCLFLILGHSHFVSIHAPLRGATCWP